MIQKTIYSILFGLFCLGSFGQKSELEETDHQLSNHFKEMLSPGFLSGYDSLAPTFKDQLLACLSNPVTFTGGFDSLSKYLTIITSPDKKINFTAGTTQTGENLA